MSYLLKKNKKFYSIFKISLFLFLFLFFILGSFNYTGDKLFYIVFSVVSNYLIYFAFRKNFFFFESFFSLLLWLGFWFKFTATISLTDGIFREGVGDFSYDPKDFDKTLFISTIGIFAFILSGYLRELFLFNYSKIKINEFLKFEKYYKYRKYVLTVFLFIILIVALLNGFFKIYQKGLISELQLNFVLIGIIKWLLLFGLTSVSSIILYFEIINLKKINFFTIFIITLENFLSSLSMLSRGMIFNSTSIFYGMYKFSKSFREKISLLTSLFFIIIMMILFYISILTVNHLRVNFFYVGKSYTESNYIDKKDSPKKNLAQKEKNSSKKFNIKTSNSEVLYLIINRWVGIDPIMAMTAKKEKLSFNLFFSSFNERFDKNNPTFYESTFNLENDSNFKIYDNVKGNTLVGIIGFLYYSGSLLFVFISIIIVCLFASFIEYLAFKLSYNNLIFSSLIGQVIAFRFIHFGYLPHQSYLLFGTIILNILLVFLVMSVIKNLITKN